VSPFAAVVIMDGMSGIIGPTQRVFWSREAKLYPSIGISRVSPVTRTGMDTLSGEAFIESNACWSFASRSGFAPAHAGSLSHPSKIRRNDSLIPRYWSSITTMRSAGDGDARIDARTAGE